MFHNVASGARTAFWAVKGRFATPLSIVLGHVVRAGWVGHETHRDPAIAEPTTLPSDLLHFLADSWAVRRVFAPDRLGIDTDQLASPALRDFVIPHCLERRLAPPGQCRQFCPGRYSKGTLSSIVSAGRRFSLALSFSSAFSLVASDTAMQPYLAFSL